MDTYLRDGFSFDVTDTGEADGRVVVLLHGFPEDRHCWTAISAALVDAGYRVLAPDQRGYSPRARPAGRRAYVASELRGDVLALADVAGATRFDVVGHDWGGMVAWDLAARCPERVRSVVSLSTPHGQAFAHSIWRSRQLLASWYMLFFQLPRVPELAFHRAGRDRVEASLRHGGVDAESARRYAARLVDPDAARGPLNWYRGAVYSKEGPMPEVEVPSLYVWSDQDRFLTRAAAEATAQYVTARYRFEVLNGVSHWIPTTAVDAVVPLILAHLRDVED